MSAAVAGCGGTVDSYRPVTEVFAEMAGASEAVHQKTRLGVLVALSVNGRSDFQRLTRTGRLSAGSLSRHLTVLEKAGLVALTKGYVGRRPHTWIDITDTGRAELRRELELLRRLIAVIDGVEDARQDRMGDR